LVVDYNAFDDHLIVESDVDVPVGPSELGVHVRRTGGKTGTISLSVDGVANEPAELPLFMTMMSSVGPSVGYDHGSAVSQRYVGPFPFDGTLHDVTVQLLSRDAVEAERAHAASEMSRQ
jgi:arylsulfatase